MKVRMRVYISGTRDGRDWPRVGEVLTTTDREGAELCAQGYAEPVVAEPEQAVPKRRAEARKKS